MQSISLEELDQALDSGASIIDCRPTNDFAASHIPNSISSSINGSYEYMVQCLFDKEHNIIIIAEKGRESEAILRLEIEGYSNLSFFNFGDWISSGRETSGFVRISAKDAVKHHNKMKDVSNSEDWEVLHVKEVDNVPLIDLVKNPSSISEGDILYCGNGHKSMAAASFMAISGINVTDIIGGLSAMLVDAPDLEI
jgi:rhodanese-related sulfurtransferase